MTAEQRQLVKAALDERRRLPPPSLERGVFAHLLDEPKPYVRKPYVRKPSSRWPRRRVIAAIRAWAAEHGRPPTWEDWRRSGVGHPSAWTTQQRFGSWSKAIRAAGFEPRTVGAPAGMRRQPKRVPGSVRMRIYSLAVEGLSKRAIAREVGLAASTVAYVVRAHEQAAA